jgi:hypothetical protein
MGNGVRIVGVDDSGIRLQAGEDVVLDAMFSGRRIWSFWTRRDTGQEGEALLAPWPPPLRRFLNGSTRLSIVEHVTGDVVFDDEVTLGSGTGRIEVVDAQGRELGFDKSNRLTKTFGTRDDAQVTPLLDAIEEVLSALRRLGIEPFLAYGTLLGAVRESGFIGHDSDIDLGYVSSHEHPVDVIRESYRLQRELRELGYEVDRYSGAAFKVHVRDADGVVWGLDVFGGFFLDQHLYLMGEIGTPFRREWISPLGTCTLVGRTLPAPARADKLLEATYGPSWRVPDPAFRFATPVSTSRRLNGWFRGARTHRAAWDRQFSGRHQTLPRRMPSPLARFVVDNEGLPDRLVDLGAGRGADALWFARQGVSTLALDHARGADTAARRTAEEEGLDYRSGWVNLHELRSVLAQGAQVAHWGEGVTVLCNHVLDATDRRGLAAAVRFARMALSRGGRLYADFLTAPEGTGRGPRDTDLLQPLPAQGVVGAFRRAGADIVLNTQTRQTLRSGQPERGVTRVVAQWRT